MLYRQLGIASRGDCSAICGCLTLLHAWIYEYFPVFRPHRGAHLIPADHARALRWEVEVPGKTTARLATFHGQLDRMTAGEVTWLPYGPVPDDDRLRVSYAGWIRCRDIVEPYMPDRALRQVGYTQPIPAERIRPDKAVRSWRSIAYKLTHSLLTVEDTWLRFPSAWGIDRRRCRPVGYDPTACDPAYMDWYMRYSHPHLLHAPQAGPVQHARANSEFWFS
ncbi:protein MAIN-LIKE 1-like [Euphorbia lathyris]|uniref:protein MAIN-LIKE 1-like n=1 Tax=Euphorbia lathyris TaxID=212925 RepID=UPI0033139622